MYICGTVGRQHSTLEVGEDLFGYCQIVIPCIEFLRVLEDFVICLATYILLKTTLDVADFKSKIVFRDACVALTAIDETEILVTIGGNTFGAIFDDTTGTIAGT